MHSLKYDLKVFLEHPAAVPLDALIPLFHGWIQEQRLAELLIDVADYRHVPQGPGVVLVAHDAHYAVDQTDGRVGLLYSRRRETHASRQGIRTTVGRLASLWQCALTACHYIEMDPTLPEPWRFCGNEVLLRVNDRLLAPPTPESYNTLCQSLEPLLATLYPDSQAAIEPVPEDTSRLTVRITAAVNPTVATLLARLETRALEAITVES